MVVVPWYVYVFYSLPFLLFGLALGSIVAGLSGVPRPFVVLIGMIGAVSGEWLGLLSLPRLANSFWLTAFAGGLVGSCLLSLLAARLLRTPWR